jgi:hypothetical protein
MTPRHLRLILALFISLARGASHPPGHAKAQRNTSCTTQRPSFVILAWPHSGAEWMCRVLGRHPELSCAKPSAGEFMPKRAAKKATEVPRRMLANCSARVCGYRVLPTERLAASALGAVVPQCATRLIVERSNRNLTAELAASSQYASYRVHTSPP